MAKVSSFADRLNEGMRIRGKKAIEISRETGIDNASISYWRHGKYEATQTGIYLLAKALDVSEAWLMGYDVPMEREPRPDDVSDFTFAMHRAESDLSESDKQILIQMARQLADANKRGRQG